MNPEYKAAQITKNALIRRMVDEITTPSPLLIALRAAGRKPPTRWQRMRRWLEVRWERIVLAYRVLRGDDIHEDCY